MPFSHVYFYSTNYNSYTSFLILLRLLMMVVGFLLIFKKKLAVQLLKLFLLFFMLEGNSVVEDIKFLEDYMVSVLRL